MGGNVERESEYTVKMGRRNGVILVDNQSVLRMLEGLRSCYKMVWLKTIDSPRKDTSFRPLWIENQFLLSFLSLCKENCSLEYYVVNESNSYSGALCKCCETVDHLFIDFAFLRALGYVIGKFKLI